MATQQVFWYASVTAQALLVLHLLRHGLFRRYRALTMFLIASLLRSAVILPLDVHSREYFVTWRATEYVIVFWLALVACEVFYLSLRNYRAGAVEWAYMFAIAVALGVGISLALTLIDGDPLGHWERLHHPVLVLRRCALTVLLVFLVALDAHCRYRPPVESVNLFRHRLLAIAYFGQLTLAQFIITAGRASWIPMVNMIALPISALCFLGWMLALGPDGEYMERVITTPERIADVEGRAAEFENFMRSHSPWGR